MQINVKIFDVSSVATNVLPPITVNCPKMGSTTVEELKKELCALGSTPNSFDLCFNGQILHNSATIDEIGSSDSLMLFALVNSSGEKNQKIGQTISEMDVMRIFNGFRLCLSDRKSRKKLHATLLSKETTKALITSVPDLANDLQALNLLRHPLLLYRMAAMPDECRKLLKSHPSISKALDQILPEVSGMKPETLGVGSKSHIMLNDPVVALVTGLGMLEEEGEQETNMRDQALRQRMNQLLQNMPNLAAQQQAQQQRQQHQPQQQPSMAATVSPQMLSSALSAVLLGLNQQRQQQQGPTQPASSSTMPAPPVQSALSAAQRFASELETIRSMGIANDAAALAALEATDGNIEAAIEFIFSNMD